MKQMRCPGLWSAVGLFALGAALLGCDGQPELGSSASVSPADSNQPGANMALRLGSVLGGAVDDFRRASSPREFHFPADHGVHPEFRSEWWYLTCPLRAGSGAEFGVQFTLFRQGLEPRTPEKTSPTPTPAALWRSGQIYMAHAAITDVEEGVHSEATRLSRGHPDLAGVSAAAGDRPFSVYLEDWRLVADDGNLANMNLALNHPGTADGSHAFQVQLALSPTKPIVLQGDGGLSSKGGDEASYYYSLSRMTATGALRSRAGGEPHNVRGACWFDREWSTSVLAPGVQGWDLSLIHI